MIQISYKKKKETRITFYTNIIPLNGRLFEKTIFNFYIFYYDINIYIIFYYILII